METAVKNRNNVPVEQCKELLVPLIKRFDKNMHRHQSIDWAGVQAKKILLLFFIFCCSCENTKQEKINQPQEKFDKVKWAIRKENEYPYREQMLKDFIVSYQISGLKKEAILDLLGEPSRRDTGYLFYLVSRDFLGSFPVPFHTKTLVIRLKADSTVEWRKIHQ